MPSPAWENQAQAIATVFLDGDEKFDNAAEETLVSARYTILHWRSGPKLSCLNSSFVCAKATG
ncbi:hypothetical protein BS47DRAFT_1337050 [Hydnum rufescens UP504]|uniref:Uncharacterized protein n=1 Tax=Hydnum rufescens UP504 TaxID=1448309 RepID=A0A9P6E1D1_9AGAM|nr:hypothetical protein BS47DRAFT_1337050 [Hydnum rufescens UP504]